jgi:hypothetical protein
LQSSPRVQIVVHRMLLSRHRLVFILVLGLLSAAMLLNGHLVPAGDNATYMVLGQSLVTGKGYRMISDPRSPEMALYPPGYPLLVAGVLALTGTVNELLAVILPLKWLSVAFYLGAIGLAYVIFERRNSGLATATALLMTVNPELLHFSNEVGTEIPYLFLSLGCILLFERYRREPSNGMLVYVALMLALTFYVRSIALVLAVSFGVYLLIRRHFKHTLLLLFITGVLVLPWFIYTSALPTTGTSVGLGRGYFALYFSSDPYGVAKASSSDLIARLVQNLRIYALDIWPGVLFPHASSVAGVLGPVGAVFPATISALLLLGFVLEARRGQASEWYAVLFFASCVGYLWAQSRLVVPIIPFAVYYFLVAIHFLLELVLRTRQQIRNPVLTLACLALLLSALVADVRSIQRNLHDGFGQSVDTYYARDAEWSNYLQAMRWIVTDTTKPAAVVCRKADLLYILTGHRALEYPYSADGVELMKSVRDNRVAYVIEDAFTWTRTTQQYLQPALEDWLAGEPAALSLAFETGAPRTRVWRVQQ